MASSTPNVASVITDPAQLLELYQGQVVARHFSAGFVALSYVISLIGAGSALELINRRTSPKGKFNLLLLVGSAVSMGGIAIWCMHFIGNRALELADGQPEMQVAYSSGFTALSFFVPILVLLAAYLAIGTDITASWWQVGVSGLLSGTAICGMHYLGNASIYNYSCEYHVVNVVFSAAIAVAASIVALAMFFISRATWASSWWKRLASAFILAGAVSGMHWCAATGTSYRFLTIYTGKSELSRNVTVIIVICLSLGACCVMAGTAFYSATIMANYAKKAQKVTLAAAIFNEKGQILVTTDGLLPSEKITDSFPEKNGSETFSTAHPLFHWMFRASRNWGAVSSLIGPMATHLARLPHIGRGRHAAAEIKLTNEHGEAIENYDVVLRELFCLAAQALAEKTKEHITTAGTLWDEIYRTGDNGEQAASGRRRDSASVQAHRVRRSRKQSITGEPEDAAEKGLAGSKESENPGYGRGSLMFLVRHAGETDVKKLQAARFRFADIDKVYPIIASSMQIKADNLEGKLRAMAQQAEESQRMQSGIHVGFFAVRARVGSGGGGGFDVLVKKGARNTLPSKKLDLDRLEGWHLDILERLNGRTAADVLRHHSHSHSFTSSMSGREVEFAREFLRVLESLRAWIADPIFEDAVLVPRIVSLPGRTESNVMIAFRLLVPIHAAVYSPNCEFIPLSFFKVQQLAARHGASQHHLAFTCAVHVEFGPILNSVVALDEEGHASDRPRSERHSTTVDSGLGSKARKDSGRAASISSISPTATDSEDSQATTSFGRPHSPAPSNRSSSTMKLWPGGSSSSDLPISPSGGESHPVHEAGNTAAAPTHTNIFGGIMVSQEIVVAVEEGGDTRSRGLGKQNSIRRHAMEPSSARDLVPQRPVQPHGGPSVLSADGVYDIEMHDMFGKRWPAALATAMIAANVQAETAGDSSTFVDELFTMCVDNR